MNSKYATNSGVESKLFQNFYPQGYNPYRTKWYDYLISIVLMLVSLITYLKTISPSVIAGDSGELTTEIYNMGACHPPGYPLYGILGKLFTFLPFGDIGFRVNIFHAAAGAAAVLLVYLIFVKLLGFNRDTGKLNLFVHFPAIAATFVFMFGYTNWFCVTGGKFYSLNMLLVAFMIYAMIHWYEEMVVFRNEERFHYAERMTLLLAFSMGLSITNHQLPAWFIVAFILFLLPMTIFIVVSDRSSRFMEEFKKRSWVIYTFLILAGICVYLFLKHGYFNRLLMPADVFPMLTAIFLVPIAMAVYTIGVKMAKLEPNWVDELIKTLCIGLWLFLFAMTLYLYLMVRAIALAPLPDPKPLSWGDTQTLDILFNHMLRRQYGMGGLSDYSNLAGQIKSVLGFYVEQFHWVNVIIGLAGLVYFFIKDKIWTIYTILAIVFLDYMLITFVNFDVDPRTLTFQEVMYNQSFMFLALYVAFGYQLIMDATQRFLIPLLQKRKTA